MKMILNMKGLALRILILIFCIGNVGKVYADEVADLIVELKLGDMAVRAAAAEALVRIGKPAVEPLIAALLRDED